MNLQTFENDYFRQNIQQGDISLSPKVKNLSEKTLIKLFEKIQMFIDWRNEAIETHSFGIVDCDRRRYIFSISTENRVKTLNIRLVGEFF